MPLDLNRVRAPRPTQTVVPWEGDELNVTYDRNAFTVNLVESIYTMPIRRRLVQVLMSWDLLKDGQPWQPEPRDHLGWDAIALARREMQALIGRNSAEPLSDQERAALHADPVTSDERRAAYADAWEAILAQLPREFVKAVDTGVLDDFLGVGWRSATSANGSAPAPHSGGAPGGTTTPRA